MDHTIFEHWRALIWIWVALVFVSAMPSPKSGGFTNSLFYAWVFTFLHSLAGGIPRIFGAMLPNSAITKILTNGGKDASNN